MTRIVAAAIRQGSLVFSESAPARHGHVLKSLAELVPDLFVGPDELGFVTNAGVFVDRLTAKGIAREAGQLLPSACDLPELFSEDVW